MSGVDLLDDGTDTLVVTQRSESGQGIIMGSKTGNGMLLCMLYNDGLVVSYVSGDCSLVAPHVNVSYPDITAIFGG